MVTVTEAPRRFEVFTGAGRRRRWAPAEKAQIVAESFSGAESVCAVARRYGLASTQLFAWRREAKAAMTAAVEKSAFVPVVVDAEAAPQPPKPKRRRRGGGGGIELEIDGVVVRVGRGADRRTLETVLRALKVER